MNKNKFYNPDLKFKKDLKWYQKIRGENKQREKACKDYYGPNFKYNKPAIDPYIYPGVNTYKLMHPFELNNDNCQIKKLPPKIIEKGNNYYTNIDNKDDCNFYKNWIERSVKGRFDNYTLIMKEREKILGFCTITEKNHTTAIIGLIGTIKNTNGYGSILIKLVENYLVSRGIKKFYVITQGRNHQAQKLYDKNFYKIDKVECYYHLWL